LPEQYPPYEKLGKYGAFGCLHDKKDGRDLSDHLQTAAKRFGLLALAGGTGNRVRYNRNDRADYWLDENEVRVYYPFKNKAYR
jgi:hypothetical protein